MVGRTASAGAFEICLRNGLILKTYKHMDVRTEPQTHTLLQTYRPIVTFCSRDHAHAWRGAEELSTGRSFSRSGLHYHAHIHTSSRCWSTSNSMASMIKKNTHRHSMACVTELWDKHTHTQAQYKEQEHTQRHKPSDWTHKHRLQRQIYKQSAQDRSIKVIFCFFSGSWTCVTVLTVVYCKRLWRENTHQLSLLLSIPDLFMVHPWVLFYAARTRVQRCHGGITEHLQWLTVLFTTWPRQVINQ